MAGAQIKALTLNCWGISIPFACKIRNERIAAICDELSKSDYDVVFLQEIWSQSDYQKLKKAMENNMAYAHYFKSGIIGSGLCVFSRHQIMSTSQLRFSVSGYAHKLLCGDWYGEKSLGLARLVMQPSGIRVNAYTTHLHAQYTAAGTANSYDCHRCFQAYQLASYVKDTSSDCDVVIIAGDFNITSDQIGYELIKTVANVEDSWKTQSDQSKAIHLEATCSRPDNTFYTSSSDLPARIDYFFHQHNTGYEMECMSCELGMRRGSGGVFSLSDHEGVVAVYEVRKNKTTGEATRNEVPLLHNLEEGVEMLQGGVEAATLSRWWWLMASVVCVVMVVVASACQLGSWTNTMEYMSESVLSNICWVYVPYALVDALKLLLFAFALFSFVHGAIVLTKEINNVDSLIGDMQNRIKYLSQGKKQI